jgi:hypothetical protein
MKKDYFYWGKSIQSWHWRPKSGSPVLTSQEFSFDINTEHKTYHGVGAVLAFLCCYFRIQYTKTTETLCLSKGRWVRHSENVWGFPDQDYLCLQVSNVEGRWVGSGRGLVQSGDALRLYCKISCFNLKICETRCSKRLQGRGRTRWKINTASTTYFADPMRGILTIFRDRQEHSIHANEVW